MLRGEAKFFGWLFLAVGILGFVPRITVDGLLFGIQALYRVLERY